MPLRIGFDMDGVFADMEGALLRHAESLFGREAIARADPPAGPDSPDIGEAPAPQAEQGETGDVDAAVTLQRAHLTPRQQRGLWRHVSSIDGFWESLDEIEPGMVARLGAVASERAWEVIFLTKRPPSVGASSQVQTQRWLTAKGFPLPSVFVVQGSRGRIAAALDLDVVVDDRPENCLDVALDSVARAVLVWRGPKDQIPPGTSGMGIGVLTSTAACLDTLVELDAAPNRPGLMERVLRGLGLKRADGPP